MTLHVEQPDVNQEVYMYFSLQSNPSQQWDIARCHVTYAGNINLPFRKYSVTDHSSVKRPYYGGLDSDIPLDRYQNWAVNQ